MRPTSVDMFHKWFGMNQKLLATTRMITVSDFPRCAEIAKECRLGKPIVRYLHNPCDSLQALGYVAEYGNKIVGFCIYEEQGKSIDIDIVGVSPMYQRRGVGTWLVGTIKTRDMKNFNKLTASVSDQCLEMHCLLRSLGFIVVEVAGKNKDTYIFEYQR
jgi:GNAT superfamily N-acetyltransferase